MDPSRFTLSGDDVPFSGCISYRPITSATFFMDYAIWKNNPLGHHLTNILLHYFASLCVGYFCFLLTRQKNIALMAMLLFLTHPIQSEVVNHIGYRSDLLSMLFYLLTFICFTHYRRTNLKKRKTLWLLAVYFSFFLSLLSKESALTLPFMLFLYDYLFLSDHNFKGLIKKQSFFYGFMAFLWIVYLYIYFIVMPSAYYPKFLSLGATPIQHLVIILKIFYEYLLVLFLPFKITTLPPMYAPTLDAIHFWEWGISLLMGIVAIVLAFKAYKINKGVFFSIVWFFITYAPTSNIMPLPNPIAFRFMYLPSVGFFLILAIFLEKMIVYLQCRTSSIHVRRIFYIAFIGFYISLTIPHNVYFKNNIVSCKKMIKDYPGSSRPYWILGLSYFEQQNYTQAIHYIKKFMQTNVNNPFILNAGQNFIAYHTLGRCYVNNLDQAIKAYQKAIALKPDFIFAHLDLAKAFIIQKNFKMGLQHAKIAIQINEKISMGYVYAAHCLIELKNYEEALIFIQKAQSISIPEDVNVQYVKQLYEQRKE